MGMGKGRNKMREVNVSLSFIVDCLLIFNFQRGIVVGEDRGEGFKKGCWRVGQGNEGRVERV